jgi:hypothetical protein
LRAGRGQAALRCPLTLCALSAAPPASQAATAGNLAVVQTLVSHGVDVQVRATAVLCGSVCLAVQCLRGTTAGPARVYGWASVGAKASCRMGRMGRMGRGQAGRASAVQRPVASAEACRQTATRGAACWPDAPPRVRRCSPNPTSACNHIGETALMRASVHADPGTVDELISVRGDSGLRRDVAWRCCQAHKTPCRRGQRVGRSAAGRMQLGCQVGGSCVCHGVRVRVCRVVAGGRAPGRCGPRAGLHGAHVRRQPGAGGRGRVWR